MPPHLPTPRSHSLSPSSSRPTHPNLIPSSSSPTNNLTRSHSLKPPPTIHQPDSVDQYHIHFVEPLFQTALHIVQTRLPRSGPIQPTYNDKLLLYSLFKQAVKGDAKLSMARPGVFDMLGRAKWDAWKKREGLSSVDAKKLYVESLLQILRLHKDVPESRVLIETLRTFRPSSSTEADLSDSESALESCSPSRSNPASSSSPSSHSGSGSRSRSRTGSVDHASALGPYLTPAQLPDPVIRARQSASDSASDSREPRSQRSSEHAAERVASEEQSRRASSLTSSISPTHHPHSPDTGLQSQIEAVEASVESLKSLIIALAERIERQEALTAPPNLPTDNDLSNSHSAVLVGLNKLICSCGYWWSVVWSRIFKLMMLGDGKVRWSRLVIDGLIGGGVVWMIGVLARKRIWRRVVESRRMVE